jgi:hypothetical protein
MTMTVERALRLLAGLFTLLSLALAVWIGPYWLIFTALIGANLLQSAFTDWCPAVWVLQGLGLPRCQGSAVVTAPATDDATDQPP